MRYLIIFIFFVSSLSVHSQIVSKKEFRLKDSKPFFSDTELSKNPKLFSKPVTVISIVKTGYKSPWISFAASFLVPGVALGQLYNEQFINFGVRFGISAITLAILLLENKGGHEGPTINVTAGIVFLLNWITSFIEAPISSASINKKNGRK